MQELIWKKVKDNEFVANFVSQRDQQKIYVKKIESAYKGKKKKICLFLIHDISGYHGRFSHLVEWGKKQNLNIDFFLMDHLGYGLSGGTRGHFDSVRDLADDLSTFLTLVEKEKGSSWCLLGHGVGGLTILDLLNRFEDPVNKKIDKTIMSNFIFDLTDKLLLSQDALWEKMKFMKGIFNHSKVMNLFEAREILSSVLEQAQYLGDPLICRKPTFQSILAIKNKAKTVFQESYFVDRKILLLESQGSYILKNGINSFGKGVKKELLSQKIYSNIRYDLYNDTGKELVFTDIYQWIQE